MPKLLCSALLALLLAVAPCAFAQDQAAADAAPAPDPKVLLVLATQGIDPARDEVRYNEFIRDLGRGFFSDVSPLLRARGIKPVLVLDQDLRYNPGQKLAIHAVRNQAGLAMILTLLNDKVDGEDRLHLHVQYAEIAFVLEGGRPVGVRPANTREQRYLIGGSRAGFDREGMDKLAPGFVKYLEDEGRLK